MFHFDVLFSNGSQGYFFDYKLVNIWLDKIMHRHIQTTNAIESLFSHVRQRTDQIDVFTTETSCLAIVWATIQDIRLHKIPV